jgi:hypothetical protein
MLRLFVYNYVLCGFVYASAYLELYVHVLSLESQVKNTSVLKCRIKSKTAFLPVSTLINIHAYQSSILHHLFAYSLGTRNLVF